MRWAVVLVMSMTLGAAAVPDLRELNRMIARFAPAELKVDTSGLSAGDKQALQKLIEAARVIDSLFLTQRWSGNAALRAQLQKDTSALGKARLHYFDLNKGPWSDLDGQIAFLPGVPPKKLPGANFYPEDMTKDEFETWAAKLPKAQQEQARGFFTVIRRRSADKKLIAVPYSKAYAQDLERAAKLLEEAAAATPNATLKEFLKLRAQAFPHGRLLRERCGLDETRRADRRHHRAVRDLQR